MLLFLISGQLSDGYTKNSKKVRGTCLSDCITPKHPINQSSDIFLSRTTFIATRITILKCSKMLFLDMLSVSIVMGDGLIRQKT